MIELPYPLSLNRYWTVLPNGRIGPTAEGRRWKAQARQLASLQRPMGAPFAGAVVVQVQLHPRETKDGGRSEVCVDIDNAVKLALDALQGVAYVNDRQIEALTVQMATPKPGGGMTIAVAPI